ncbi:MAG: hypothetical protein ACREBT_06560 [Thermoplasmata archaeon]
MSADNYLRHIGLFVERFDATPRELMMLAKRNPSRLRDEFVRYAVEQKQRGRLDSYISKSFEGLRSFFGHHDIQFRGFPALSPIRGASLSRERVPTPEELGRILEHLSLRGRVIALFLSHSGVRPGVLGSYGGEHGLTLGDISELSFREPLELREIPFLIQVPAHLSKTRRQYVTFGTGQLAASLLAYLETRARSGEALAASSPVVAPGIARGVATISQREARFGRGFLCTKNVVKEIRKGLTASLPEGVTWRPYVLRSYCSTRLLLAEGHGKISRDLREAILGHDGGTSSRYNVGKRWGDELRAEARREFANASEFLETNAQTRTNVAVEFRRTLLEIAGLPAEEAIHHMTDSNEELVALLRDTVLGPPGTLPALGGGPPFKRIQRSVPLSEAEGLLSEGWTYVAHLGPERVIMQPPQ